MSLNGATQRHALVVCDVQTVALNVIPDPYQRRVLLDRLKILVAAAVEANHLIVLSGLAFSGDYREIPTTRHKLFGALKRLYEKTKVARWFVRSSPDTDMMITIPGANIVWRSSHMPTSELRQVLGSCTNVTVVGIRTGFAIQSTVQQLCDWGLEVSVVDECVQDNDIERHDAIMKHLIPGYANVVKMADWLEEAIGLKRAEEVMRNKPTPGKPIIRNMPAVVVRNVCHVGRGGHAWLYAQHLLARPDWCSYPSQAWYSDDLSGKTYFCPLLRETVEFCDEPRFSKVSVFMKGREWLDEKDKLWALVGTECLPMTYTVVHKKWVTDTQPGTSQCEEATNISFVKECNKNGGLAVKVCKGLSMALSICQIDTKYVVQEHIANPLLTIDGRKCHVKAYFLLSERKGNWSLYSYPEAFLSVAETKWSMNDPSRDAQITTKRTVRLFQGRDCTDWTGWPVAYEISRDLVSMVVSKALSEKKLESRGDTPQFELFCADVVLDTDLNARLLELNFGCVLFDPTLRQPLTTAGLKLYQSLYDMQGDGATVNDHRMIADVLALVLDGSDATKWHPVRTFSS